MKLKQLYAHSLDADQLIHVWTEIRDEWHPSGINAGTDTL